MAGVTPQQRGGSSATTIGMVVSIIVAVALLGTLIWLFTQQEQLRTTAEQATRAKERLAKGSDETVAKQMFPEAGGTLVGEMNKGVQLLCARLTGNQNDSPQTALKGLDVILEQIKEDVPDPDQVAGAHGSITIIKNLHQMLADEQTARKTAEADLAKADDELGIVRKANTSLDKNFKDSLAKLASKVDELQRAKNELHDVKEEEIKALAQQISDKQEALDAARQSQSKLVSQARQEVESRERSLQEQSRALADLRSPGIAQAADPLAIARQPAGTVLRALPGDALVHIDLGRKDKVTLGMTFSVYSGEERIPADGRGKANIEVVSVGEHTAECRITTPPPPDDPILPGDKVGNIILSRNKTKKTRVCFVGDFDVDFDGRPDPRGVDAYKALGERYGVQVVSTVDAMTDYVVVGLEPPVGAAELEKAAAPETGAATDEQAEAETEEATETAAEDQQEAAEEAEDEGTGEGEAAEETGEEAEDETEEEGAETEEGEGAETEEGEGAEAEEDQGAEEGAEGKGEDAGAEATEDENEAEEADEGTDEEAETEEADQDEKPAPAVAPTIKRAEEQDPTQAPRQRRAMSERERYFQAIRRAEMFAIPRLRQDQFLNFIGIEAGPDGADRLRR